MYLMNVQSSPGILYLVEMRVARNVVSKLAKLATWDSLHVEDYYQKDLLDPN
jgi:hypothetical protein